MRCRRRIGRACRWGSFVLDRTPHQSDFPAAGSRQSSAPIGEAAREQTHLTSEQLAWTSPAQRGAFPNILKRLAFTASLTKCWEPFEHDGGTQRPQLKTDLESSN